MPLFHINDHNGDYPPGDAGREFPDIKAALADANRIARAVLARRRSMPSRHLRGRFDIKDETRRPVARIVFAELAHRVF